MTKHELRLHSGPFNAIRTGNKTVESRLYDEKRRQIELGDEIVFLHRAVPGETVTVKVIGLLRYDTFSALFRHNDPSKFGGESIEVLESNIGEFYSIDEQHEDGVIGIEFERI